MSYEKPIPVILGSGDIGLALKAQRTDKLTGADVGSPITTGFVEIGGGNYQWSPAAVPTDFIGGIKIFDADNNLKAFGVFDASEQELTVARIQALDEIEQIKAKTDTLGAARVTTVSPVSVSGDLQIIRGDDYAADDGASRVFEWSDDESVWPDLDGATITFKCKSVEAEAEFIEGTPNKIRLELSKTNTTALPAGRPRFSITATLANEHVVTLIVGSIRFVSTEGLS
jgi:hypothetical protein